MGKEGSEMTKTVVRIKTLIVGPENEPVFSERQTEVSITDEAGGEYVVLTQSGRICEENEIAINPEEWPLLREAIDQMVKECREDAPCS